MTHAVMVPGRNHGPGAGLMMYAGEVAARRGATLHRHSWSADPPVEFGPGLIDWVRGEIEPVLAAAGEPPLLVGKSLGTLAAGAAAERGLPAVWLTPLLTVPWAASALADATAPFLLVGGTGDRLWDGRLARRLSPHVLEVEHANHGMLVPGPLPDSAAVLGRVLVAIDEFLDRIGWPRVVTSSR